MAAGSPPLTLLTVPPITGTHAALALVLLVTASRRPHLYASGRELFYALALLHAVWTCLTLGKCPAVQSCLGCWHRFAARKHAQARVQPCNHEDGTILCRLPPPSPARMPACAAQSGPA